MIERSRRAINRGFTLIELMIVVVILGILGALVIPNLMSRPEQARVVAAKQDISMIMQALKLYRLDNGKFPTQAQGLKALSQRPSEEPIPRNWNDEGYLSNLPQDPWGMSYQYRNPGQHGKVDVFSFGPDGKEGDSVIGSWSL